MLNACPNAGQWAAVIAPPGSSDWQLGGHWAGVKGHMKKKGGYIDHWNTDRWKRELPLSSIMSLQVSWKPIDKAYHYLVTLVWYPQRLSEAPLFPEDLPNLLEIVNTPLDTSGPSKTPYKPSSSKTPHKRMISEVTPRTVREMMDNYSELASPLS